MRGWLVVGWLAGWLLTRSEPFISRNSLLVFVSVFTPQATARAGAERLRLIVNKVRQVEEGCHVSSVELRRKVVKVSTSFGLADALPRTVLSHNNITTLFFITSYVISNPLPFQFKTKPRFLN